MAMRHLEKVLESLKVLYYSISRSLLSKPSFANFHNSPVSSYLISFKLPLLKCLPKRKSMKLCAMEKDFRSVLLLVESNMKLCWSIRMLGNREQPTLLDEV